MLQCVPQGFLKPGASARFRMDSSGGKNASSGFPTETIGGILFSPLWAIMKPAEAVVEFQSPLEGSGGAMSGSM